MVVGAAGSAMLVVGSLAVTLENMLASSALLQ
jgi:hypothetical protein